MGAIGAEDWENWENLRDTGNGRGEKILVLVRLRPLNEKEISRNEVVDWECINSTTILYRNSLQERSGLPTTYSLDKVFRGDCTTREVYEDGIKDIALSVLDGINSTIFAYGQTNSGKTYTMNGITEYTVADIYNYIQRREEREFVLKFSAIEIYNEVVTDLLGRDNTPLRMLDDPERGTVIERLTEETLRDLNHLKELLTICEVQRQTGETLLNETSSRSHQILRLKIESSAREFLGKGNLTTLAASVNFVDLAGSERASQALSVGQRLKEGCHINRSLLTLGTVIRKLSKGTHGHINYRDSKLTRILQPSLGGNARTAIICTLNPARSNVEQSRNTLLFASCAKEVSTNAKVNVVMSDKALVKQLQKELARLESELRTPGAICDHAALLRKKDMQIQKLEKEIMELKKQCDLAHSRIENLIRTIENNEGLQKFNSTKSIDGDFRHNRSPGLLTSESGEDNLSDDLLDRRKGMEESLGGIGEDSDDTCKEVRCVEEDESDQDNVPEPSRRSTSEDEESRNDDIVEHETLPVLPTHTNDSENGRSYGLHLPIFQDVHKSIDSFIRACPDSLSPGASSTNITSPGRLKWTGNRSCVANLITGPPEFEVSEQIESTPPTVIDQNFTGRPEGGFLRKYWKLPPAMYGSSNLTVCRNNSQSSASSGYMDETKDQNFNQTDEEIPTLGSFVTGLREIASLQFDDQSRDLFQETDKRGENNTRNVALDPEHEWPQKFEKLQKSIVQLWQACNVSLVHRTYFILLVTDEFTDSIYMEVEYRRLSFLRERFSGGNSAVQDGHTSTLALSEKGLRRERGTLSKLVYKKYTKNERRKLYDQWGIDVNSKRRRLQLVNALWNDTKNIDHVTRSADIVAKLIGFSENDRTLKEMLGLSFTTLPTSRRSFSWKKSMSSLL